MDVRLGGPMPTVGSIRTMSSIIMLGFSDGVLDGLWDFHAGLVLFGETTPPRSEVSLYEFQELPSHCLDKLCTISSLTYPLVAICVENMNM